MGRQGGHPHLSPDRSVSEHYGLVLSAESPAAPQPHPDPDPGVRGGGG